MAGVDLQLNMHDVAQVILPRLEAVMELEPEDMLDAIGAMAVEQTQRRIKEEKTAPDGTAWPPNLRDGSILMLSFDLVTSIAHHVSGDEVAWGSDLVYAAIHQWGGKIEPKNKPYLSFNIGNRRVSVKSVTMPQRQYLGLSGDNQDEIVDMLNARIAGMLQ